MNDSLERNSAENSTELSRKSSQENSQNDETSVTSQVTVIKVNIPVEHSHSVEKSSTISESASNQFSPPSTDDVCVETGSKYVEDLSFPHSKAQTKPEKKVRGCTCLCAAFRFISLILYVSGLLKLNPLDRFFFSSRKTVLISKSPNFTDGQGGLIYPRTLLDGLDTTIYILDPSMVVPDL